MREYSGTDGLPGQAGGQPMTPAAIERLSRAAAQLFTRPGPLGRVLIGKDSPASGGWTECALVSGFTTVGMDVVLTGPLPTPALAMLTRALQADLGVMISAPDHLSEGERLKVFRSTGFELNEAEQAAITHLMRRAQVLAAPDRAGRVTRMENAAQRYAARARHGLPANLDLAGLRIVVDAANGATFKVAPELLRRLGAEVLPLNCAPEGRQTGTASGAEALDACRAKVLMERADLGIRLDGDGGRVVLVDEAGRIVDGDQIIALIAERLDRSGRLASRRVVSSASSNLGLDRHLANFGIEADRTAAGGRNVIARIREFGTCFGGDRSGQMVLTEHAPTGDGLVAALQVLAEIAESRRPTSEVLSRFRPLPQVTRDVSVPPTSHPLDGPLMRRLLDRIDATLGETGRLTVRPSATAPMIRIVAEGEDRGELERIVEDLSMFLERSAGDSVGSAALAFAENAAQLQPQQEQVRTCVE